MAQREIASGFVYPQTVNMISGTSRYGRNIHKPFRILKGVDVEISFFIKDQNGKPINLVNNSVSCILVKSIGGNLILSKPLTILNETNGNAKLTITSLDTLSLVAGFYDLIVSVKSQNSYNPVYLDTTFSEKYHIEILDNFINALPDISETTVFTTDSGKNYTQRFPSSAQISNSYGISTFAVTLTNFTGNVVIQATLETSPKDTDWFSVNTLNYQEYTGNDYYVFEGKFYWVRFFSEITSGTVDKIWYLV